MDQTTILAVDDDRTILESVSIVLELAGYNLLTAVNPIQALDTMNHHVPDLIVSDINMPKMDGYEFYEAVRNNSEWVSIPFIFLSALREQKDVRAGYKLGADHYLLKPFSAEDLLIAVESRLQRSADIKAVAEQEVESTKQQLLHIFDHELRTPLTFIQGYLSMLQEGDVVSKTILNGMHHGVNRLNKLVEDLMLVVRLENELVEKDISDYGFNFNVSVEIEAAVNKLKPLAAKQNIKILQKVDSHCAVFGISRYMRDVFERLIENAIKFSEKNGRITITTKQSNKCLFISIRDEGIGIAPDKVRHIFNRFQQIDRNKIEQQGVGLGLAISERLVQHHGGTISVKSKLGSGSMFTVSLPIQSH
ncbi:MAG: hybrid sensor histidine kinase/response regulator [Chloroflexi bacterium]|nr:MAG: hybrid sensor histidine kinase/response regulator [Chloroflexota bacterium]